MVRVVRSRQRDESQSDRTPVQRLSSGNVTLTAAIPCSPQSLYRIPASAAQYNGKRKVRYLLSAPCMRTSGPEALYNPGCGSWLAAPAIWNSLPSGIRDASSTHTFRRLLKTHCFQQAFGSPWRLAQVSQIRPLADIVHSKYSFTYLLTYYEQMIPQRTMRPSIASVTNNWTRVCS